MAPLLDNGTAYHQLVFAATGVPEPWITSIATHWDDGTEPLGNLSAFVRDQWISDWRTQMASFMTLVEVRTIGKTAGGVEQAAVSASGLAGTNAVTDMLPSNCALLVRKVTALRGRRNRGRMYIPGVLEEAQVNAVGSIVAAELTGLQNRATSFFNALVARVIDSDPVILHETLPATSVDIQFLTVDPIIATQRRRMR